MIGLAMQTTLEEAAHRALDLSSDEIAYAVIVHPAGIQIEGVKATDDGGHRAGHLIPWSQVNRGESDIFDAAFKWVEGELAKVK